MDNGNLLGYYDNDTAATDELLVKYLSQNKDVILGDIISTIQKEQNEIIRQSPFQNVIVQGVAGSGKTTVAMHRMVQKTAELVMEIQEKGYHTIAVICRTAKEAEQVEEALRAYPEIFPVGQNAATKTLSVTENFLSVEESEAAVENRNFSKGVMVLPIYLTKGLEFDSVILWNPDKEAYRNTEGDAKLLYVAITRALHELHIVYEKELTELLE